MPRSTSSHRQYQATTEREAATARAATLLREILDYQNRLNRLATLFSGSDQRYLIEAYQRQIERRRMKLKALPKPLEAPPNPWS